MKTKRLVLSAIVVIALVLSTGWSEKKDCQNDYYRGFWMDSEMYVRVDGYKKQLLYIEKKGLHLIVDSLWFKPAPFKLPGDRAILECEETGEKIVFAWRDEDRKLSSRVPLRKRFNWHVRSNDLMVLYSKGDATICFMLKKSGEGGWYAKDAEGKFFLSTGGYELAGTRFRYAEEEEINILKKRTIDIFYNILQEQGSLLPKKLRRVIN